MSNNDGIPTSIVILFDPSNKHDTLDADRYSIFYRVTALGEVFQIIDTRQFKQINLHVPIEFDFNSMLEHPDIYIHTYFLADDETSDLNIIERQKIRESIRDCCVIAGEEFIERGVMESNIQLYDEGLSFAELLRQMNIDQRDRLLT